MLVGVGGRAEKVSIYVAGNNIKNKKKNSINYPAQFPYMFICLTFIINGLISNQAMRCDKVKFSVRIALPGLLGQQHRHTGLLR